MTNAWAVLASGQSLTAVDVSLVKHARETGLLAGVAAVSNVGIDLAPWADCLVSHDSAWWSAHPAAFDFKGVLVGGNSKVRGGTQFKASINGCNSGLMAMEYVRKAHKAKLILILGFDMHGTHYFGKHTNPRLKQTSHRRFREHIAQFNSWHSAEVINCTPKSALKKFPCRPLTECLIDLEAGRL